MATNELRWWSKLARSWDHLLAGRPLIPLAAVALTTSGHAISPPTIPFESIAISPACGAGNALVPK